MRFRTHPTFALVLAHVLASYLVTASVAAIAMWANEWRTADNWIIATAPITAPVRLIAQYAEVTTGYNRQAGAWVLLCAVLAYCLVFAFCFTRLIGFWDRPAVRNFQRCAKCGYDLRATPLRCPECGEFSGQLSAQERLV